MTWEIFIIIALIMLVLGANLYLVVTRAPPAKNIEQWAHREKLKITRIEAANRGETPFSWLETNLSYEFHHIRVLTENGAEKSGYLCVAGQLSPLFSEKVRVRWDDEK